MFTYRPLMESTHSTLDSVAQDLARLDATLREEPVFVNGLEVKGYKAIVVGDKDPAVAIVGKKYTPYPHSRLVEVARKFADAGWAFGGARVADDGMVAALAFYPPSDLVNTENPDALMPMLFLVNSLNGRFKLSAFFAPTRIICWNVLVSALAIAVRKNLGFFRRHTAGIVNITSDHLYRASLAAVEAYQKGEEIRQRLKATPIRLNDFLASLRPVSLEDFESKRGQARAEAWAERKRNVFLEAWHAPDLEDEGENAWRLVQAAVAVDQHGELRRKRNPDAAFLRILQGTPGPMTQTVDRYLKKKGISLN